MSNPSGNKAGGRRHGHPPLAGVAAVLSADPADGEFYRAQRRALAAAADAAGVDLPTAESVVGTYLRQMGPA